MHACRHECPHFGARRPKAKPASRLCSIHPRHLRWRGCNALRQPGRDFVPAISPILRLSGNHSRAKMDLDALLPCMQKLYCHAGRCMEYHPIDLMHETLPLHCMHDWQACNAWEWHKYACVETWQKLTAVLVWCHRETQMRRFLATTASFPSLQEPCRDLMRSSSQSRPPLVRPAEYY